MGFIGQKKTNEANKDLMRETHDYQQRNSDTQYVRAAADLKAAGINPILAPQFGGASTPSGNLATMTNPMQGGLTGASTAKAMQETGHSKIKTDLDKLKKPKAEVNAKAYEVILTAIEAAENASPEDKKALLQGVKEAAINLEKTTRGFIQSAGQTFSKSSKRAGKIFTDLFKSKVNQQLSRK